MLCEGIGADIGNRVLYLEDQYTAVKEHTDA